MENSEYEVVELAGEKDNKLIHQPCQTSTNFLEVARGHDNTNAVMFSLNKWTQIRKIINNKASLDENFADRVPEFIKGINYGTYLREKVLSSSENYLEFVKFLEDEGIIKFEEDNPQKVSQKVVYGVANLLPEGKDYSFKKNIDAELWSDHEINANEFNNYLNKASQPNNPVIERIFSISNITEMKFLFENNQFQHNIRIFYENAENNKELLTNTLFDNENGRLALAVMLDEKIIPNFNLNNEKLLELGEEKNGQYLLATLVKHGLISKDSLKKIFSKNKRKKIHQDARPSVLSFWEKIFAGF